MSAQSGGAAGHNAQASFYSPVSATEAANAAKRQLVSRKRDVELVLTKMATAKDVFDTIVSSVNPQQVECIQQINAKKFLISFKALGLAEAFLRDVAPAMRIADAKPACRWLGSERKAIRVPFLPCAIPNSELSSVLANYGRVVQITDELYADSPAGIKTGTRLVEMDMTSPVPNLITVCGFTVPVTYRGVLIQCRRCLQHGHMKAECRSAFCDRCRQFGHESLTCTYPCLKCGSADHHWKQCPVRSYAFVAASQTPVLDTESMNVASRPGSPGGVIPTTAAPANETHTDKCAPSSDLGSVSAKGELAPGEGVLVDMLSLVANGSESSASGNRATGRKDVVAESAAAAGTSATPTTLSYVQLREEARRNLNRITADLSNSAQAIGDLPSENSKDAAANVHASDDLLMLVDDETEASGDVQTQAQRVGSTCNSAQVEEPSKNLNNGAEPACGYDAGAAGRNVAWHVMQTRNSKRRQSSVAPGISPVPKRPSGKQ